MQPTSRDCCNKFYGQLPNNDHDLLGGNYFKLSALRAPYLSTSGEKKNNLAAITCSLPSFSIQQLQRMLDKNIRTVGSATQSVGHSKEDGRKPKRNSRRNNPLSVRLPAGNPLCYSIQSGEIFRQTHLELVLGVMAPIFQRKEKVT